MKFTCDKSLLNDSINNVIPAVSSKSTLICLEGIFLRCENNQLIISGYNLELGIKNTIPVDEIEKGAIVLNAVLLSNIITKMPEGKISFDTDEKLLTIIKGNESEFTILGLSTEDYPNMPVVTNDKSFPIAHFLLKSMIAQTLFSIAQSDQNPIHMGSLFEIEDGTLTVVSVDGYRLALRKEKVSIDENFKFVVPGKTLAEIVKLLTRLSLDKDEAIQISVTSKHINFLINGYTVTSRLLEGEFLDYKSAIPKESKTIIEVETRKLNDCISRAAIIISDRAKSPIRCTFEDSCIRFFCETALGKINDLISAKIDGSEVVMGFNNKYMGDALRAAECERILLEINGPISPMKIVPIDDDNFLFLVLPVRLK